MKEMKLTLGEKFQLLRQNAERTEKEMAKELNLALTTYMKIEEDFLYPTDSLINKVAKLYGMTYEEFLAVGEARGEREERGEYEEPGEGEEQ